MNDTPTVTQEHVAAILAKIAKRSKDNGTRFTDTSRLDAIASVLAGGDWSLTHDGNLVKIYACAGFDPARPVVVVSTHVDMVAERCYADCSAPLWKGSFDNLITNAVVTAGMTTPGFFDANVLVAFTGDEECDSRGADEVVTWLRARGLKTAFVAVTDVTYEGYSENKAFSLENVFPERFPLQGEIVAKLRAAVAAIDANPYTVVDGDPDEAWEYDEFDLACCSVCFPCTGDMHSETGVSLRAEHAPLYAKALAAVTAAALRE